MANPYIKGIVEGDVSGIPADMQPQISRKQKLAEQLLAQGQQPLEGEMVGNQYVAPSWTQYLAKGLQSYMGGKGLRDIENQQAEALKAKREAIANILKGQSPQMVGEGENARQETPEEVQARTRPQLYEAVSQYGNDPALQLALGDLNYSRERGARKQDIAEERAYTDTREEKLYNRNRADKLSDRQADQEFQRILEKDRQGFQLTQQDRQFAQQYKIQQAQQAFQAQQQRQSQAFQAGQNQLTREQQLALEKAKSLPQATQKTADAKDVLGILQQAAPLVNKSTGSGLGAMVDATQGFFGGTNQGAIASSQLKALEGLLVSKMPKMSGPQSDKDVLLYKQMAGQIGDPTIPPAQKRAAMETINEINAKYVGVSPPTLNFDSVVNDPFPRLNVSPNLIEQELARRNGGIR